MLRFAILFCALSLVAGCGTLRSSSVDETETPAPERATRNASTTATAQAGTAGGGAPSSTPDSNFTPNLTATAAGGFPIAETPPPCATDPTVDPVVAATEAAQPSNTPDPDFVPDYGATATAEVVGTVPSGSPYCPDGSAQTPPTRPTEQAPATTPLPVGSLDPLTFSAGPNLLNEDLAARGKGLPGRGAYNVARIQIPRIGVDSAVTASTVGADGNMQSPPGLFDVLWYDFSAWQSLGGLPGAVGNAIFAGSVGEPGVRGVFNDVYALVAGDAINVVLVDGRTLTYRIEFNKIAQASLDWTDIVSATADESLTIITGANNRAERRIVWARRIS